MGRLDLIISMKSFFRPICLTVNSEQCDHMARSFIQYLAIYNN